MAGYSSAYNLTKYEEMFSTMNREEKVKTTDFLRYICTEHLQFKRSKEEENDIRKSTKECLQLFCSRLGRINPAFTVGKVFPVGSMAEDTRIIEPSEFDFIVALNKWSGNIDVKRVTHKMGLGLGTTKQRYDAVLPRFHNATQEHATVTFPGIINTSTSDADMGVFLSNVQGKFWDYKHYEKELFLKTFEACKGASIEMPSGTMMFHGFPDFHGPVYSVGLMWKPKDKESTPLRVDVDIAPAIFIEGVQKVFYENDVLGLSKRFTQKILEIDSFLLMPARKCFDPSMHYQFAFTNTEVELIKKLSATHKKGIKILKWFFPDHTMISSFILKTCVLIHSDTCTSENDEWHCTFEVLKILVRGLPLLDHGKEGRLGYCNIFMNKNLIQYRIYKSERVNNLRQYMLNIMTTLVEIGCDKSGLSFQESYEWCKELIATESTKDKISPFTPEDSMIDAGMFKT